ncbi:Protein of unknown function [Pyronema omphalodes CBS 100304]|uniref:Uncharacterized protein n=1 Tax=Pyronema omphalodes (strain CBS 100304) TaxID=1076935 RepID=U4L9N4_PYROM|nr:Protein of unknown function [Pyronema omphalodes CBS 100304]
MSAELEYDPIRSIQDFPTEESFHRFLISQSFPPYQQYSYLPAAQHFPQWTMYWFALRQHRSNWFEIMVEMEDRLWELHHGDPPVWNDEAPGN